MRGLVFYGEQEKRVFASVCKSPELHNLAITDYLEADWLDEDFRRELTSSWAICSFHFDDFDTAREVLASVLSGLSGAWLDTSYAWVIRGEAFVANCRDPEWDWRHFNNSQN